MPVFSALAWVALVFSAFCIGLSKTALPGLATLSVVLFAAVLPARQSTAVMLLLLLCGDLFSIYMYRRDAHWATLRRLLVPVVVGVAGGAVFLYFSNDLVMRRAIGWIILILTAITLWIMYRERRAATTNPPLKTGVSGSNSASVPEEGTTNSSPRAKFFAALYGTLGGFTTMAANAGGPVMSLYFLWVRFPVTTFLGTTAWFFFLVNLVKLPFSATLGLISGPSILLDLCLLPAVAIGAVLGRLFAQHLTPAIFNPLIIVLTIGSAIYLVI